MLNIEVHYSTIRKRLHKYDLSYLRQPQDVLMIGESKVEIFGFNAQHDVWWKSKENMSVQSSHMNYQGWWWRGGDLG